jgi:hypothetical protein
MQLRRQGTTPDLGNDDSRDLGADTPRRIFGGGWRRASILTATALALGVAPVAIAASAPDVGTHARAAGLGGNKPMKGAIHNPASGAYFRTTGIFANVGGWTARIKNVGAGGAATFACHAAASGLPCLQAENSKGGLAFTFAGNGGSGGQILLTNANAAPFTTNAHGVATGLNANYLQGKQASEFQLANQPAEDASKLGGQPASSYVGTGQLLFADVAPAAAESEYKLEGNRGATAVSASGGTVTVTFGTTNVSKCSYTASPIGAALSSGQIGVAPAGGNTSAVAVSLPSGFKAGFDLQVVC